MHNQNNVLCELGNLLIEYQLSRLEEMKEDTDNTLTGEPVSSEGQSNDVNRLLDSTIKPEHIQTLTSQA